MARVLHLACSKNKVRYKFDMRTHWHEILLRGCKVVCAQWDIELITLQPYTFLSSLSV